MIFLLITVITLLMALIMTFYQSTRKTYPGFSHWVAGTWIMTCGYVFLLLRGVLPDMISIICVNTSFPIGVVWSLQGMQLFLEQKKYRNWIYIFPLFSALTSVFFYYVADNGSLRNLFMSVSVAIPNALMAVGILRSPGKNRSGFYLVIASVIALNSVLLLLRALIILLEPSFNVLEPTPIQLFYFMAAAIIQIAAFISFILLNSERLESDLNQTEQQLQENIRNLQKALNEVKTLGALLPICAHCKKIRDDEGYWHQLENYISTHSDTQFSHGICPECLKTYYPEFQITKPENAAGHTP